MFVINDDKSIYLTRGDIARIEISAQISNEEIYMFSPGDVVRLKVFERKKCDSVILKKDVVVQEEASSVVILLNREDTKFGELINKPKDYWYEVEINPDTYPQTIIGYDEDGEKIFRIFPEGGNES